MAFADTHQISNEPSPNWEIDVGVKYACLSASWVQEMPNLFRMQQRIIQHSSTKVPIRHSRVYRCIYLLSCGIFPVKKSWWKMLPPTFSYSSNQWTMIHWRLIDKGTTHLKKHQKHQGKPVFCVKKNMQYISTWSVLLFMYYNLIWLHQSYMYNYGQPSYAISRRSRYV